MVCQVECEVMRKEVELNVPHRHVETDIGTDWMAVEVNDETAIINEAGEGSATCYTVGGATKNPRVIANADAVMWGGIVGLTNYDNDYHLVSISHRFGGVTDWVEIDELLDEPVPVLERTNLLELKGTGGIVEFDCIDCGEHIKRERHQMDIPGMTPSRCTSCTFGRMGGD